MRKESKRADSFFGSIFGSLLHGFGMLLAAFVIGTGASAVVCLFYGVPLAFSLIGGFIVLGIAVALMSESPFF